MKILVVSLFLLACSICHAQSRLSVTLVCEGEQKDRIPICLACREPYIYSSTHESKTYTFNNNQLVAMNGSSFSGSDFTCDISEESITCEKTGYGGVDILRINRISGSASRIIKYRDHNSMEATHVFSGLCKVGTRQF